MPSVKAKTILVRLPSSPPPFPAVKVSPTEHQPMGASKTSAPNGPSAHRGNVICCRYIIRRNVSFFWFAWLILSQGLKRRAISVYFKIPSPSTYFGGKSLDVHSFGRSAWISRWQRRRSRIAQIHTPVGYLVPNVVGARVYAWKCWNSFGHSIFFGFQKRRVQFSFAASPRCYSIFLVSVIPKWM